MESQPNVGSDFPSGTLENHSRWGRGGWGCGFHFKKLSRVPPQDFVDFSNVSLAPWTVHYFIAGLSPAGGQLLNHLCRNSLHLFYPIIWIAIMWELQGTIRSHRVGNADTRSGVAFLKMMLVLSLAADRSRGHHEVVAVLGRKHKAEHGMPKMHIIEMGVWIIIRSSVIPENG